MKELLVLGHLPILLPINPPLALPLIETSIQQVTSTVLLKVGLNTQT